MSTLITWIQVYLGVGALIWLVLERLGIVRHSHDVAVARGERRTKIGILMATAMVIVWWPPIMVAWLKGMVRT